MSIKDPEALARESIGFVQAACVRWPVIRQIELSRILKQTACGLGAQGVDQFDAAFVQGFIIDQYHSTRLPDAREIWPASVQKKQAGS